MHSDTYNTTHDATTKRNEGLRQSAVRTGSATQAQAVTADIAYYRAVLASAKANGLDQGPILFALWTLGARDG